MLDGIDLKEIFLFIGRVCKDAEIGWWTWHATMKQDMFVFLVFGMMSSDLMVGNPACGARSVLNSASPCRFCGIPSSELDNPDFSIVNSQKTPQLIDEIRTIAAR